MKKLAIVIASLAALSGCATYYPAPAYANRGYAQPDPNGWRVVSVTPVAPGTGAASANGGVVTSVPVTNYDADPYYATAPVVVAPAYAPYYGGPAYDPFWAAPVSIGLGFSFGNFCCRGGHYGGHYGHFGGRPGFRHR